MNTETKEKDGAFVKGIVIDVIVYLAAFCVGAVPFLWIGDPFAAAAAFTAAATVVVYVATVIYADVSIYDPYWSVAPPVILLAVMIKYKYWNANAFILLALVGIWSFRLTANWLSTYKGLGHEDWRYARYRASHHPFVFQLISFFGLQTVPTAVVYLSLVSGLLAIREPAFSPLSCVGILVMACAVLLELFADAAIHDFLREHAGENKTCNVSVWRYSRHPNYLGEMSFWAGLYLYFVAVRPDLWYLGLGFLSIIVLFLAVSIPLMEKHNAERRADYAEYKAVTSMLLPLPPKKRAAGKGPKEE